jgi:hypothetical protein
VSGSAREAEAALRALGELVSRFGADYRTAVERFKHAAERMAHDRADCVVRQPSTAVDVEALLRRIMSRGEDFVGDPSATAAGAFQIVKKVAVEEFGVVGADRLVLPRPTRAERERRRDAEFDQKVSSIRRRAAGAVDDEVSDTGTDPR